MVDELHDASRGALAFLAGAVIVVVGLDVVAACIVGLAVA